MVESPDGFRRPSPLDVYSAWRRPPAGRCGSWCRNRDADAGLSAVVIVAALAIAALIVAEARSLPGELQCNCLTCRDIPPPPLPEQSVLIRVSE